MAEQIYPEGVVPSYIQRLRPYVPGKPIAEVQKEFGLESVVKLASNENSLGPSPKAIETMLKVVNEVHRYPGTANTELCAALAKRYNVKISNVILGSGSESIMSNVMRTFFFIFFEVLSVSGTFVGFSVMAHARATAPVLVPLDDYRFNLEAIAQHITPKTKIIYLCNPNNPTGTYFTKAELDQFLAQLPKRILVILDEAYFEFTGDSPDFPDSMRYRHDQVITLRTFSKAYGLAGLRVGYGLANESLIKELYKVKLPFEPSVLAQAAGLGALEDDDFRAVRRELKAFHLTVSLRELAAVSAVGLHRPELTATDKGDGFVVEPSRVGLALAAGGQLSLSATFAVAVHHADDLTALVGFYIVIAHLIGHLATVRRGRYGADTPHGPQGFGGHHATTQLDVTFTNHVVVLCFCRA